VAPHQITTRALSEGSDLCRFQDLSITHRSDALRRLCRAMVARGLSGPAEVRGEDGKLRMTIRAIERSARWTLSEGERGFSLTRYVPHPYAAASAASVERVSASAAQTP